jgi:hypothetical protein
MCERAVLTNRPSLDLSPFVLEGHRACRGAWDRSGVFLNPNSCMGLELEPSKEGSWMMAQNDLVVAGIDVAKDKVDVCIRSQSLRRTFAATAEGRRELASWLRRRKVGKAVMEASGGYEREWAKALRDARIEVRIVDPKRVRSFAQSAGRLAKNDTIDAEMIAWFAETFDEARGQAYDAEREELHQMVNARQALKEMQTKLEKPGRAWAAGRGAADSRPDLEDDRCRAGQDRGRDLGQDPGYAAFYRTRRDHRKRSGPRPHHRCAHRRHAGTGASQQQDRRGFVGRRPLR